MSKQKDTYERLAEWRRDRNITEFNMKVQVANIVEELFEMLGYENTKPMVQDFLEEYYDESKIPSEYDVIDAGCDIKVFVTNMQELMGYDAECTMHETISEISSRVQDPEQKAEWELNGPQGKWQKDKAQSSGTLYKANYDNCKRVN